MAQDMSCIHFAAVLSMQLSWDVLADVGFLCDRSVKVGAMIKQRPCIHGFTGTSLMQIV